MRHFKIVLLAGSALWAHPAIAADALQFGPAPAWVAPKQIPDTKATEAPVALLLHDQQTSLAGGKITTFTESAFRIQTPQGLSAGNLSIVWQPATETVTVHKLQIHRGDKVIDVLANGQTFTILRRETNLEAATLDGTLTANIQPEGLQQGDIVDFATTIEHADPVLKGHVEATFAGWNGMPFALAHAAVTWPSRTKVSIRESGPLPPPVKFSRGGNSGIEITARNVEPVIPPTGAPKRYSIGRLAEATDFASWAEVADLVAPLFRQAAVLPQSGPLHDEVERIRASTTDPKKRAEQALALVENRVRYVALLMGQGGYVPAPAETTWSRRFGDCKAKTALLLAILHALAIDAEPVLVQSKLGDAIADRLPSMGLFDHVLVRARIAGKTYWLDGTRSGDTALDDIETPDFGWGLPIAANAALVHIVPGPLDRPDSNRSIAIDASAGMLAPATIDISTIYRGDVAVVLNTLYAQATEQQRDQAMRKEANSLFDNFAMSTSSIRFDKDKRELTVEQKGSARLHWDDGWYYVPTASLGYNPDLQRAAGPLHDAPFATDYPNYEHRLVTIRFPKGFGAGQEQKQPAPVSETLLGVEYRRTTKLADDVLTVESSERSVAPEVPYKEAVAEESRLRKLNDDDVYVQMPSTYRPTEADLAALNHDKPVSADEYFVRGGALLTHGKIDEAISDLTAGLALDGKSAWARTARARGYIAKRQFADAEQDLHSAEALDPNNADIMTAWGDLAVAQGKASEALAWYDKADQRAPNNDQLRLKRVGALAMLGKNDAALSEVNRVLASNPSNVMALLARGEVYEVKQDWVAADRDLNAAQRIEPKNTNILLARASLAANRHDYKAALDLASKVLEADPNNESATSLRTHLLTRENDQGDAMQALNAAVTQAPHDKATLLNRARAYLEAKNYEAADKDVTAALTVAPDDLAGLWLRASIAQERGDFASAVDGFTAVLQAYPSNGPVLAARAEAYRQERKYDLALGDTQAALKAGYTAPSLRLLRINILLPQGDVAAIATEVEQLVKENPTSDYALVAAGKAYQAIGMTDKAMASFDRALALKPLSYIYINRAQARPYDDSAGRLADLDAALKLEPDSEDALSIKAWQLSRLGKHAEAIALYDQAIRLALDPSRFKRDRAIALARAGRLDEAKKELASERAKAKSAVDLNSLCWSEVTNDVLLESALDDCRQALRKDPNNAAAGESLAMVLLKLGKLPEALAAYNKALDRNPKSGDEYMGRAFVYARMHDPVHARADADRARKLRPDIDSQFASYGLVFGKEMSTEAIQR